MLVFGKAHSFPHLFDGGVSEFQSLLAVPAFIVIGSVQQLLPASVCAHSGRKPNRASLGCPDESVRAYVVNHA
jgi:hypothetical protein